MKKNKRVLILVLACLLYNMIGYATTYKVTTTEDHKEGSLRWAIEQANKESVLSRITFSLPAGSVVVPDTTIDIKSSMVIDGNIDGEQINVSPSNSRCALFHLCHVTLDSVVLQNLNIYEKILEETTSSAWMNCLALIDSTAGHFILRDCHVKKFQYMVVSQSDDIHLGNFHCVCDTMLYSFYTKKQTSNAWKSLCIDNSRFIYTKGSGYVHDGGTAGITNKIEIKRSYVENVYSVTNGTADSVIYKKNTFKGIRSYAIKTGSVKCKKIIVDSCSIINAKAAAFHSILNFADISFTNNIVNGSGTYDISCYRDINSSRHSKIVIENNVFGSKDFKGKGIYVDATNTQIRNNTFYGVDGYCEDLEVDSRAIMDCGSDTLLIENNNFGFNANEVAPNKYGDILLQSEYYLRHWKKAGFDYDFNLVPQITIKDNQFLRSAPNAISIDSTKLNVTITDNLFLETQGSAISNIKSLSIPILDNIARTGENITIVGHVDSLAKIELFYTSGAPQTAEEFIDSIKTDENGGFEFSIPYNKLKNKEQLCFTATATYSDGSTSNLSEVYCCPDCHLDPTRKEYYVKTERTGDGDGSSWENAMSCADFADILPKVEDGATFYVEEEDCLVEDERVSRGIVKVVVSESVCVFDYNGQHEFLYPNPTRGNVHLKDCGNACFEVTNPLGIVVLRGTTSDGGINLSTLPAGIYWIRVGNEATGYSISKIVKE